jgi:hypothetical protein
LGQTIKTNTFPDGGTRIETFHQDGSLLRTFLTPYFWPNWGGKVFGTMPEKLS